MTLFETNQNEVEEKEEEDDSEASIDDGVLDEISADKADEVAEPEGFGHISEHEEVEKEKVSDPEEGGELEEDAEDVDFDTFDDVDEF